MPTKKSKKSKKTKKTSQPKGRIIHQKRDNTFAVFILIFIIAAIMIVAFFSYKQYYIQKYGIDTLVDVKEIPYNTIAPDILESLDELSEQIKKLNTTVDENQDDITIYTNTSLGYEITYPSDWFIEEIRELNEDPSQPHALCLADEERGDQHLLDWCNLSLSVVASTIDNERRNNEEIIEEDIILNEQPALKQTFIDKNTDTKTVTIIFEKAPYIYVLSYDADKENVVAPILDTVKVSDELVDRNDSLGDN